MMICRDWSSVIFSFIRTNRSSKDNNILRTKIEELLLDKNDNFYNKEKCFGKAISDFLTNFCFTILIFRLPINEGYSIAAESLEFKQMLYC